MNRMMWNLYRIPDKGVLSGVCAGLADQLQMPVWVMRAIWIVAGVYLFGLTLVIYIAMWMSLDKKSDKLRGKKPYAKLDIAQQIKARFNDRVDEVKDQVWPTAGEKSLLLRQTLDNYQQIETRLQKIEQYVTSTEFTLSREINKL